MSLSQWRIDLAQRTELETHNTDCVETAWNWNKIPKTLDCIQHRSYDLIMGTKHYDKVEYHTDEAFEQCPTCISPRNYEIKGTATMTTHADKRLEDIERGLRQDTQSPKAYFVAADAANDAGKTEKATRYLRMALNNHNNELLNQYDIKSLGESNNA